MGQRINLLIFIHMILHLFLVECNTEKKKINNRFSINKKQLNEKILYL